MRRVICFFFQAEDGIRDTRRGQTAGSPRRLSHPGPANLTPPLSGAQRPPRQETNPTLRAPFPFPKKHAPPLEVREAYPRICSVNEIFYADFCARQVTLPTS